MARASAPPSIAQNYQPIHASPRWRLAAPTPLYCASYSSNHLRQPIPPRERHQHEPMVRAGIETMFRWFEQGKLNPTASHRFPLSDYAAAMDAVLARQAIGKVVLEMPRAHP
jgi:NADPH:quinone reductase-like Zn-dependent oxidoreductase